MGHTQPPCVTNWARKGGGGGAKPSDVAALMAVGGVNRLLTPHEDCVGPPFLSLSIGGGAQHERIEGPARHYSLVRSANTVP